MGLYEQIRDIAKNKGYSINRLEQELGFARSSINKFNKNKPSADKLQQIADLLNVPMEYLMGKEGLVRCPVCGLEYLSSNLEDCKNHEETHRAFEEAVKRFGTIYPSTTYETLKSKYLNQATDNKRSIDNRINDWIEVIRAYWSRSLTGCGYDLRHPDFDKYASMLLNQAKFKDRINNEFIYEKLVSMYGTSEGIEDGRIYYKPKENISVITARDERDIAKDLDNIMNKLSAKEYGPAAYDGEELDPEAADLFKDELEIALRRLKMINKEKYTPKKYKK